jgi:DNA-binding MarR family transcriptional regulator
MAVNPVTEKPAPGVKSGAGPEADDSVEEELGELVRRVRPVLIALKRGGPAPPKVKDAFERTSLGPRHAPALMTVALEGKLSVSELAEQLGLSLSTTSLLVGELNRAGLLERAEDDSDRRRTIVRLNAEYRDEAEVWLQERLDPFRRTLQRLSPSARANFLEGWRILDEESSRIVSDADPDCQH